MLFAFIWSSKKRFINSLSVWFSNVLPDRFKSILNLLLSLLLLLFSLSVFANKLFVAVTNHDTEAIRQLIATGADVNIQNGYGNTPLHEAIYNDFTGGAHLLINAKANVNIANQQGMTAFHVAAFTGNTVILTHLLHDIDNINLQDGQGNTIFHLAARKGHMSCVRLLVNYKENIDLVLPVISDKVVCLQHADIDINIKNNDGNIPLHLAAREGHYDCLRWLLTVNSTDDINTKNNNGLNPIVCAVETGHTNCVELLMKVRSGQIKISGEANFIKTSQNPHLCAENTQGCPVNIQNKNDHTPFCSATEKSNKTYVSALLKKIETKTTKVNISSDSLHNPSSVTTANGYGACTVRDLDSASIKTQKTSRATANTKVLQCVDSLSHCTISDKNIVKIDVNGNTKLHQAAATGDIEYIQQRLPFITSDEVNARNNKKETALHKCSLGGHTECIKLLLTVTGIDINPQDDFGSTAVHAAVYKNQPDCLQLLINSGADVSICNNHEYTALHTAVEYSCQCIPKLIGVMNDESINLRNKFGCTALNRAAILSKEECVSCLLSFACVDINKQDSYGNTPLYNTLMHSARKNCTNMLLKAGADIQIKNNYGSTVFHVLVGNNPDFIEKLSKRVSVDFINIKDMKSHTALHKAVIIGDLESVKQLVSAGADCQTKNSQGVQPFHFACLNGDMHIVKYFLGSLKGHNGKCLVDINCQDDYGNTPLYDAGINGHKNIFQYLIRKGADQTIKNKLNHHTQLCWRKSQCEYNHWSEDEYEYW